MKSNVLCYKTKIYSLTEAAYSRTEVAFLTFLLSPDPGVQTLNCGNNRPETGFNVYLPSQRSSSTAADVMIGDGQFNTPAAENEISHLEGTHRQTYFLVIADQLCPGRCSQLWPTFVLDYFNTSELLFMWLPTQERLFP